MAFDENLAERVREHLAAEPDLVEKKMFGGIAFMLQGNMAVGVSGDSLMVRVGLDDYETALAERGVGVFGKTGSSMRGWVLVSPRVIDDQASFETWVDRGRNVAMSLPPK